MIDPGEWKTYVESLDYNALFVTISGAHLYGFPSPDSDVDLRGCHQVLTGIHLMRTGEVEANLIHLNEQFKLPFIDELIAQKTAEKVAVDLDWKFHDTCLQKLEAQLDQAFEDSTLSEQRDWESVNDLLISLRLGSKSTTGQ